MKTRTKWAATLAGAVLAAGLAASPALASPTPGPGATQNGTIQIGVSLALNATLPDFTLTSSTMTAANAQGAGSVTITSNDPTGYFLTIQGPASFGAAPTADVSYYVINNSSFAPLPTTAATQISSPSPSAASGDTYSFGGYFLNHSPAPGTYTGVVSWTLWGN